MELWGLTGNIGCGKSTVAGMFAEREGVVVHDCDALAKGIVLGDAHRDMVISIFGKSVMDAGGAVDAKRLGRAFFSDPERKARLEAYVHPLVWEMVVGKAAASPARTIHIVESAILREIGWVDRFEGIVIVVCPPQDQHRRLRESRGMTDAEIEARISTQYSGDVPRNDMSKGEFVVYNSGSLEYLKSQVLFVYGAMSAVAEAK
jgi:dephospho-CoA kinase